MTPLLAASLIGGDSMRPMNRQRRKRAEKLAGFKCVCVRKKRVQDPVTKVYETVEWVVYGGPEHPEQTCKIQSFRPYETVSTSGGRAVVTQRTEVHVPVGAGPFQIGDVFTVEGHRFDLRVAGLDEKSIQTMQRLLVDQISNPAQEANHGDD